MNGCVLGNKKNMVDPQYKKQVEQFFKVIGNVAFLPDQDFTSNIVDATVFIKMHDDLNSFNFRGISEILSPLINFNLIQIVGLYKGTRVC